jgi:uncharacterized protein YcgL (UPF0745 family)
LIFFKDNNRFNDESVFNEILEQTENVCDEILKRTDTILNLDLYQLEELKTDIEKLTTEIQLSIDDIKYINQYQESKLKSIHKNLLNSSLEEINTQLGIKKFTIKTQKFYTQVPKVNSELLAIDSKIF